MRHGPSYQSCKCGPPFLTGGGKKPLTHPFWFYKMGDIAPSWITWDPWLDYFIIIHLSFTYPSCTDWCIRPQFSIHPSCYSRGMIKKPITPYFIDINDKWFKWYKCWQCRMIYNVMSFHSNVSVKAHDFYSWTWCM